MRPYAVDTASGTERAPGHKDEAKLRAFFDAVAVRTGGLVATRRGCRHRGATRRDPATRHRHGTPDRRRAGVSATETTVEHRFGRYGGQYVPETLMPALAELERAWMQARDGSRLSRASWMDCCAISRAPDAAVSRRQAVRALGRSVYLKREDLNHTGSHKLNNALGQALLAKRMGKRRIIAETGAGQHGVATATVCALLDLECVVYMGAEDTRRQHPNVQRMRLLGASVVPVDAGARTLKEATSAAIRDWVENVGDTHYVIGSAVGPAPYPALVRDLQSVIGDEARAQILRARGPAARAR